MTELTQKIALLIDADNAPASRFEDVLSEVAKYGAVTIKKAYGNWKSRTLKSWEELLHEHAIQPVQQFDLTKGKNASDIALVIEAMDIMYTKEIDVIGLISSDCDFTPLVHRALAEGKVVLGFGERKTPAAFVNACSRFLFLDDKKDTKEDSNATPKSVKQDAKLINLLRQAIDATEDEDGWALLGPVGANISNRASFDTRNYGFKNLSSLFKAIDLFEIKRKDNAYVVRDTRKHQKN